MATLGSCDIERADLEDLRIRRLVRLAYNLRWDWEPHAASLFATLAPRMWKQSHNAVEVVRSLASDDPDALVAHAAEIDDACAELEQYLDLGGLNPFARLPRIAYLSAEFAVAKCLPIYAGGLGVLAGDHLKAASDMGLPIVGVGLLYRYGYFRQRIDERGFQQEVYDRVDPDQLPLRPVLVGERLPLRVYVPFPDRQVCAHVWRADVGRARLYLLDTDVAENRVDDRWITAHLYGGDDDTRLRQEMVLGIGGARLLHYLRVTGLEPSVGVYHLNEGHSALLVLELTRERLEQGLAGSFNEGLLQVAPRVAFTTHTPVMAGHDAFPSQLVEAYISTYRRELGLSHEALMRLGRVHPLVDTEPFSMTVLALRGAARRNGVSRLHANVSRQMWTGVGIGAHDRPPTVVMDAIPNGVHGPTWIGPEMGSVYEQCLGRAWRVAARDPATWAGLRHVSRRMLWRARTMQRARLLDRAAIDCPADRTLVIGFARRFATYKRAGLLLRDPERLGQLVADSQQPVVIILAGKAHPRDEPGKVMLQRVVEASRDPRLYGRLAFVPDYDMDLARLLVQGADVWLNTPRRPQEASGTSGMKAAMNGSLHLSELDGWWEEAFSSDVGWALGRGLPQDLSDDERDAAEADQLMQILEREVAPNFYARDAEGLPVEWLERVVQSIIRLSPCYSADRMVAEYSSRCYWPAAAAGSGVAAT